MSGLWSLPSLLSCVDTPACVCVCFAFCLPGGNSAAAPEAAATVVGRQRGRLTDNPSYRKLVDACNGVSTCALDCFRGPLPQCTCSNNTHVVHCCTHALPLLLPPCHKVQRAFEVGSAEQQTAACRNVVNCMSCAFIATFARSGRPGSWRPSATTTHAAARGLCAACTEPRCHKAGRCFSPIQCRAQTALLATSDQALACCVLLLLPSGALYSGMPWSNKCFSVKRCLSTDQQIIS